MAGNVIRQGGVADFFRGRPRFGTAFFEREEAEGKQDQGGVVVEATPAASLEVILESARHSFADPPALSSRLGSFN